MELSKNEFEPLVRRAVNMEDSLYKDVCALAKRHATRNFSAFLRHLAREATQQYKLTQEDNAVQGIRR